MDDRKERTRPDTSLTAQRLLEILCRIPRQPRQVRTVEIHRALVDAGYDVTVRTVQRDLAGLADIFPLVTDRGKGKDGAVWSWQVEMPGFEVPGMDPSTAIALLAARDHLGPILPGVSLRTLGPLFARAERLLEQTQTPGLSQWRQKVRVIQKGPPLAVPAIRPEVQATVEQALLTGRKLRLVYRRRETDEDVERDIDPLALVTKDGLVYLLATVWDYVDPTTYVLHRIRKATELPEPAKIPPGFKLDAYLEKAKAFSYLVGRERIKLELAAVPGLAFHLSERPLGKDQVQVPMADQRTRITVTTDDSSELRWWLLAHGEQVEVLRPPALRREIATKIREAAALYARHAPPRKKLAS